MKLWGFLHDMMLDGRRMPAGAVTWGPDTMQHDMGKHGTLVCDLTPLPVCALAGLGLYVQPSRARVHYQLCRECAGQPSGRFSLCTACAGSGKVPV